ncbi:MAG: 3-phosphoshikimate 1-carboxyvinyltransferase [Defluviitaleaceae bacterium]|nr:3-phosphoshikimate 1-carboxyvinyltransferase [Defluviitaleaceae bacterium]
MNEIKAISKFPAGVVTVPPSKSQVHRAIICALLSCGKSQIENIAFSQDIMATLNAACALGADYRMVRDSVLEITGIGDKSALAGVPPVEIDCCESGSTLRFVLPIVAALGIQAVFTGDGRLMERPIGLYERVFAQNGAVLERASSGVSLTGRLNPGTYRLDGNISSQFVSGLLFALPLLDGDSEIIVENRLESASYVDMTIDICSKFAVCSQSEGYRKFYIPGRQTYRSAEVYVEGDYSQAAYFLAAGALGADVACAGLPSDSLQGDRAILDILRKMGAEITCASSGEIKVYTAGLHAVEVDVSQTPDIAPPIAAAMCFAHGQSRILGAARLRFKESDRLRAIAAVLTDLGADIREQGDTLVINGKPSIRGGQTDSHADHRIAMMAALAALRCDCKVTLTGWQCVDKSYPQFWNDWERR